MIKVNNSEAAISEVLTRGVQIIYPDKDVLSKELLSGKRLSIYCGFDPSAKSLHVGNAILINKLSQFQKLGHEVIFLIGDFTGMIGDPTDKTSVRQQLTREEVLANCQAFVKQASCFLNFTGDNPALVKYNSEWHDQLGFKDLIELSANFTVQQLLARDMFQKRLADAKPIYFHEFLYPVAQAYDSVALKVDLEIGGNDQMFNMMCGRDLAKTLLGKEKFVLTTKLLADADGNKMGKTTGNALFLDQSANDMYGVVMSWPDEIILTAFELCTQVPLAKLTDIKNRLAAGENPRNLKAELGQEIVRIFHGEAAVESAAEHFRLAVSEKTAPADLMEIKVTSGEALFEIVCRYFAGQRSRTDVRRLFETKSVYLEGEAVSDFNAPYQIGNTVRVGKRDWFKIV